MVKRNSATKVIPWQCKLRVKAQFPCDAWHYLVKKNEDPKMQSDADILVVALHWS